MAIKRGPSVNAKGGVGLRFTSFAPILLLF